MAEETEVVTLDVPELRDFVAAYARVKEVERVRSETADALALAAYHARKIASAALMARIVGVSTTRIKEMAEKGRLIVGDPPPKKRRRRR